MAERDEFGAFLIGFIIGGLTGAAISLIMAPQSGDETREMLKDRAIELREKHLKPLRSPPRKLAARQQTSVPAPATWRIRLRLARMICASAVRLFWKNSAVNCKIYAVVQPTKRRRFRLLHTMHVRKTPVQTRALFFDPPT